MKEFGAAAIAIFGAIIGLAIISVLVSRNSQTPDVISSTAGALSSVIKAAVNPVTTAATNGNLGDSTFATPSIPMPKLPQSWEDIAAGVKASSGFKIFE